MVPVTAIIVSSVLCSALLVCLLVLLLKYRLHHRQEYNVTVNIETREQPPDRNHAEGLRRMDGELWNSPQLGVAQPVRAAAKLGAGKVSGDIDAVSIEEGMRMGSRASNPAVAVNGGRTHLEASGMETALHERDMSACQGFPVWC